MWNRHQILPIETMVLKLNCVEEAVFDEDVVVFKMAPVEIAEDMLLSNISVVMIYKSGLGD